MAIPRDRPRTLVSQLKIAAELKVTPLIDVLLVLPIVRRTSFSNTPLTTASRSIRNQLIWRWGSRPRRWPALSSRLSVASV